MPRFEGFVGPSYLAQSPNISCSRSVNIYPEVHESPTAKAPASMIVRPGLVEFANLNPPDTIGPIRGILAAGSPTNNTPRCFVVGAATLFELFDDGTFNDLGPVAYDAFPVDMCLNGNQLFVVSAGQSYVHNGTTLYNETNGMPAARRGAFLDNYFIINVPDSRSIRISALNDGTTWDSLDVAVKESHPDLVPAIITTDTHLWVFGEISREVWENTGNPDFPLERNPAGSAMGGVVSIYSPVRIGNTVAWVGADEHGGPMAFVARGFEAVRVSTRAVESEWDKYGTSVVYCTSWTSTFRGHQFWHIDFPAVNRTWVYDLSSKSWHERSWWNGSVNTIDLPNCHAFVFGKHLVGARTNSKIYEQSYDYTTDGGTDIWWQRICPHVANDQKRIAYSRLAVDIDTGASAERVEWRRLGSSRAPGRGRVFRVSGRSGNNQFSLDWSEDDARTWNTARTITKGDINVPTVLVDAFLDAEAE